VGAALAVVAAVLLAFCPASAVGGLLARNQPLERQRAAITGSTNRRHTRLRRDARLRRLSCYWQAPALWSRRCSRCKRRKTGLDIRHVLPSTFPQCPTEKRLSKWFDFYKESMRRIEALPGVNRRLSALSFPGAMPEALVLVSSSPRDGHLRGPRRRRSSRAVRTISPGFFAASAFLSSPAETSIARRPSKEPVVIVSQTLAHECSPTRMP